MKTLKLLTNRTHSPPIVYLFFLLTNKTKFMKLLLTIFTIFFLDITAEAQLDKSTWLVGGSSNFYSSNRDYVSFVTPAANGSSKDLNLTISPNVGYFIIDKIAIGLRPYFSWGKGEFIPNDPLYSGSTSNSKRYGIGPFARYYFLDKEKQFNILTDVSYQIGEWNQGGKGKLSNFSFLAGPVIYFNTSVGMEFLLGYSTQSEELKDFSKNSSKGFSVNIGFQIHLIN